jgi:hypothetical protein
MRLMWIVAALVACGSCGGRSPLNTDGGALDTRARDGAIRTDSRATADLRRADVGVTPACSNLIVAGQVSLEATDTFKFGTQVVFDGTRFWVAWHSQQAVISSLNGELRFAAVDLTAKTTTPTGVVLETDDGSLRPALTPEAAGGFSVVHQPVSTMGVPEVSLKTVDALGKTTNEAFVSGSFYQAAVAAHSSGHLLFLARQSNSPELVIVDAAGKISSPAIFPSAQIMSALWVAPSPTGFAAGVSTTNSNGSLILLDATLSQLGLHAVGHGASIGTPSFVTVGTTGVGYAALYPTAGVAELERYDAQGAPVGHELIASGIDAASGVGLAWSGSQLAAVFSTVPNQYRIQLVNTSSGLVGTSVTVPTCLATADDVSVVWGQDRLAVIAMSSASGVLKSAICVTLMTCQ